MKFLTPVEVALCHNTYEPLGPAIVGVVEKQGYNPVPSKVECGMLRPIREFLPYLVLVGIAGCFPATFTEVPEIKGRVVDADGRAVPEATLHVTSEGWYPLNTTLTCDADGRFFRKEEAQWGIYIMPMDAFGSRFEALATAENKRSIVRQFGRSPVRIRFFGLGPKDVADLGEMRLTQPTSAPAAH